MPKASRRALGALALSLMIGTAPCAWAADYQQAPQLQAAVTAGKLPPVAQRLPVEPLVLTPLEGVGRYGGDWRSGLAGGGSLSMMVRQHAYEPLMRYTPDWSGVTPNVAARIDASPDAKQFTITLRQGMKWSDGQPFTTDDIEFWFNDVFLEKALTKVNQDFMFTNGQPAKFEKLDEVTFRLTFSEPNGLFAQNLAWANRDQTTRFPKHYLKQFHIKYNPQADELAKSMGLSGWVALFSTKSGVNDDQAYFKNPDMPSLYPWRLEVVPGQNTTRAIAVRNPYYWKVDTAGNQLPYLDRVTYDLVADTQVLLLKAMQGEIDLIDQYIATPNNKAVLYDGRKQGGYGFYDLTPTETNEMVIQLNLTHPDPVKRELYNNKDFRVALSLAIDRQALIDAVLVGQGEPAQAAIVPGDALYNEQLATQFTGYDLAKAKALLDKVAPKKGTDGIRLDASGRPISIVFEIDQSRTSFVDMFQLILPMLREVGIDAQLRTMDRSLWEVRVRQGNEYDATAHRFGGGGGQATIMDPRYFVPTTRESFWSKGWTIWYRDKASKEAVEPPPALQKAFALYDQIRETGDAAKQNELMRQILQIAADEFWTIGIARQADSYGVVRNDLRNVPKSMPNSWGYPNPAPTNPETYWKG